MNLRLPHLEALVRFVSHYWRRLLAMLTLVLSLVGLRIASCTDDVAPGTGNSAAALPTPAKLALGLAGMLLLLAAATAIYVVWRRRHWRKCNESMVSADATPVQREEARLRAALAKAQAKLKSVGCNRARRWFHKGRDRDPLPWYLVIGAPGAGKSTVIRRMADRVGTKAGRGNLPVE